MSYELSFSSKAKKDLKRYKGNKKKLEGLKKIIDLLAKGGLQAIPESNRPHKLIGNYSGCWECHVMPDLLLIWEQYENPNHIVFIRIGSHSELF